MRCFEYLLQLVNDLHAYQLLSQVIASFDDDGSDFVARKLSPRRLGFDDFLPVVSDLASGPELSRKLNLDNRVVALLNSLADLQLELDAVVMKELVDLGKVGLLFRKLLDKVLKELDHFLNFQVGDFLEFLFPTRQAMFSLILIIKVLVLQSLNSELRLQLALNVDGSD